MQVKRNTFVTTHRRYSMYDAVSGGSVTKRAFIITVLVVAALSFGAFQAAIRWDGAKEHRALTPGDRVELESGLAFTVPDGWEGSYTKYWPLPSWTPGVAGVAADLRFSEVLALRTRDASSDIRTVTAVDYYGGAEQPSTPGPTESLAQNGSLTAVGYTDPVHMRVVTRLPAKSTGFVNIVASRESTAALRAAWNLLRVGGARLP